MTAAGRCALRIPVVAAVLLLTAVVLAPAAEAVQTSTFGLIAGPNGTTARSALIHLATGAVDHDSVVVVNRTAAPITVDLSSVATSRDASGTYVFGAPGAGAAPRVQLPQGSLTLAAHQQATVRVLLHTPVHLMAPMYAAITATSDAGRSSGLTLRERLALIVRFDPNGSAAPVAAAASAPAAQRGGLNGGLAALAGALLAAVGVAGGLDLVAPPYPRVNLRT